MGGCESGVRGGFFFASAEWASSVTCSFCRGIVFFTTSAVLYGKNRARLEKVKRGQSPVRVVRQDMVPSPTPRLRFSFFFSFFVFLFAFPLKIIALDGREGVKSALS